MPYNSVQTNNYYRQKVWKKNAIYVENIVMTKIKLSQMNQIPALNNLSEPLNKPNETIISALNDKT